jgi:hypothetical protein
MNIVHTLSYCFMGLVAFAAVAAQLGLVSGVMVG